MKIAAEIKIVGKRIQSGVDNEYIPQKNPPTLDKAIKAQIILRIIKYPLFFTYIVSIKEKKSGVEEKNSGIGKKTREAPISEASLFLY